MKTSSVLTALGLSAALLAAAIVTACGASTTAAGMGTMPSSSRTPRSPPTP